MELIKSPETKIKSGHPKNKKKKEEEEREDGNREIYLASTFLLSFLIFDDILHLDQGWKETWVGENEETF